MKIGINFDRLEVTTLFVFIGCIGFFTAFLLLFYPLFDKKNSLNQLNQPSHPVLMGELRMANAPANLNTENSTAKKEAPKLEGEEPPSQSRGNEAQLKRSELLPSANGAENPAQKAVGPPPDYRNQRMARQSHESRLATQNRTMIDALAQQELQNLLMQLPETDAYECVQTNNGIRCTTSDSRGKYMEGLLSRAWNNPSCSTVTVGKRIGIVYSKCLPE
jgi:hypothetical protein